MSLDPPHGAIFERLLPHCSVPRLPPPWASLRPPHDSHGPVLDPDAALARLRAKFTDVELLSSGVMSRDGGGVPRLCPALVHPGALVLALRQQPSCEPLALVTRRGCLPGGQLPLRAFLQEYWTLSRLAPQGILPASPHLLEVLLLRALGFAATLSLGLHCQASMLLRWLDRKFRGPDYCPPPQESRPLASPTPRGAAVRTPPEGAPINRPPPVSPYACSLALMGWSMSPPRPGHSRALVPLLAHLRAAREYLGLDLSGILAWQLSRADCNNLRFRIRLRDWYSVRELLAQRMDALADFSVLLGESRPAPPDFLTARAALLACRADPGVSDERVQSAVADYQAALQRELIEPLLREALECPNPVLAAAEVELAEILQLLHRISPSLQALAADTPEGGVLGGTALGPLPARELAQYSTLQSRVRALMETLRPKKI